MGKIHAGIAAGTITTARNSTGKGSTAANPGMSSVITPRRKTQAGGVTLRYTCVRDALKNSTSVAPTNNAPFSTRQAVEKSGGCQRHGRDWIHVSESPPLDQPANRPPRPAPSPSERQGRVSPHGLTSKNGVSLSKLSFATSPTPHFPATRSESIRYLAKNLPKPMSPPATLLPKDILRASTSRYPQAPNPQPKRSATSCNHPSGLALAASAAANKTA